MASLTAVKGLQSLIRKLQAKAAKAKDENVSVIIGYTAEYAIYVHEDLEARHKPGKQAKYLEAPMRRLANNGKLVSVTKETMRKGGTLSQGLLRSGLLLQRESQKIVPVDLDNLRPSAFTRLEK